MAQGAAASHRPTGACRAPEPTATAAQPSDPAGLLAELLEAFRGAAPAEWSTPQRLTLTAGRRSRLQAALAHAGSPQALLRQLRTALAQVPPWFRSTYPVRPDGSRRPSHQFFDVLFRASAAERDGGPEAWPVFSWSEAAAATPACNAALAPVGGSVPVPGEPGPVPWAASCSGHGASVTPAAEVDLQRAQRLFGWGGTSWLLRDIEALQISLAERRRLTALLESHGQGSPGAGARQFAEPIETAQPTALTQPTELAEPVTQPAAFTEPITQAIGLTQPEELAEPIECTQAAALTQPAGLAEAPELGQARELAPPRGLGQPAWLTAPAEPGKPSAPEACPAAGGAPTPVDSRQSPLPGPGSAPQGPWAPWPAPTGLRGL